LIIKSKTDNKVIFGLDMGINWLEHGEYIRGKCCSQCKDSSHPVPHHDKKNPFSCIDNLETASIIESIYSLELEGKILEKELLERAADHVETKPCGGCWGDNKHPGCLKAEGISKEIRDLIRKIIIRPRIRLELEQFEYDEPSDEENKIIELYAVERAEQYYEKLGYEIKDVSTPVKATDAGLTEWPGYDLLATKNSEILRIEVKGTKQVYGSPVKITSNEVNRAKEVSRDYILFIVYSIVIENKQAKRCVIKIIEKWDPKHSLDNGELVPKDYLFTPKR